MRFLWMIITIVIVVVLLAFAVVNRETLEVSFPFVETDISAPVFVIMLGFYVLGMFSGWTVIGFIRSSIHHATDRRDDDK